MSSAEFLYSAFMWTLARVSTRWCLVLVPVLVRAGGGLWFQVASGGTIDGDESVSVHEALSRDPECLE